MTAERPTGTVTFLFTDIEGSTRLWEEHPDAMEAALADHDRVLREAFDANDGYVFSTGGDGFGIAFHTPGAALTAARSAQEAVHRLASEGLSLQVRMGIHTGTADERDGDYFGRVPTRAARIMSAANGRQIAMSAETGALCEGLADTVSAGSVRLRGLSEVTDVQLVVGDQLDVGKPLRGLQKTPTNLPQDVTSFVGRESESDRIVAALAESPLVTLSGVGGVGKTRLALHVARAALDHYPDGVWLVELAPVADPAAVPHTVAAALQLSLQQGAMVDRIVAAIERQRALVLLDNCEHVLDQVADLADAITARCPDVRLLATSREPVGANGEHVFAVRSLASDPVNGGPAVDLLRDRLAALTGTDVIDVELAHRIASRLDGVPLAIELAAARGRSMSLADIEARLDERFRLLRGSRRTASERHQTLRAAVDWSYDLLEPDQQEIFDHLGVFAGSFDVAAATAVLDGHDEWDMVDALERLVEQSMVLANTSGAGETEFSLLETLRQYAEEKLVERGVSDQARSRHARHYAAEAQRWFSVIRGPGETEAVPVFARMFDNIRSAFHFALDSGDLDTAYLLLDGTFEYANWRLRFEVGDWGAALLERDPDHAKVIVALSARARQLWAAGRIEEGYSLALRGVELIESSNITPTHYAHGIAASLIGADGAEAVDLDRRWCAHSEAVGDDFELAYATAVLAQHGFFMATDVGVDGFDALRIARSVGSPSAIGLALAQATLQTQDTDPDFAIAATREMAEIAEAVDNRWLRGTADILRVSTLLHSGHEAVDPGNVMEMLRQWQARGDQLSTWLALVITARWFADAGHLDEAATIVAAVEICPLGDWQLDWTGDLTHVRSVVGDRDPLTSPADSDELIDWVVGAIKDLT